jgi:peptidoglycan-associated lipoprotein
LQEKGKIMKISIARRAATFTLVGVTAFILAACSSVKLDDVDAANSGSGNFGSQPWNDPSSPLFQRSVYFDFNEYTVQTKYQKQLSAHANFLKANPKQKIIIQGNTDERGTAEYNLALGQRRSDAVRKALNLMGVSDNQMEAVSFGKEKPKAEGDNEAAWAENRRADIVYITN